MDRHCKHCGIKVRPAPLPRVLGQWWYGEEGIRPTQCKNPKGHDVDDPLVELLKEMSHGPRTG